MAVTDASPQQQFDQELAEELEQLEYYSFGDYVEILVTGVEGLGNGQVRVKFDPPAGEPFNRDMAVPVDPNHQTKFTELLETAGYNYSTAAAVVGERVPAQYTDDGWEFLYRPDYDSRVTAIRARFPKADYELLAKALCASGGVAVWPVLGIPLLYVIAEEGEDDWADLFFAYTMGLMGWIMVVLVPAMFILGGAA